MQCDGGLGYGLYEWRVVRWRPRLRRRKFGHGRVPSPLFPQWGHGQQLRERVSIHVQEWLGQVRQQPVGADDLRLRAVVTCPET